MATFSERLGLIKDISSLMVQAFKEWIDKNPFDLSAAVAYYSIFSLPALLIIITAIAGTFLGKEAVEGEIVNQIGSLIGTESASQVQTMIVNAQKTGSSVIATIIGIATLLFGSTSVFLTLQDSLNHIWGVKPDPAKGAWKRLLEVRVTSFGVIIAIGFLLLVSLVLSSMLSLFSDWIKASLPDFMLFVFQAINFVVSFGVTTLLFALLYKVLPDVDMEWRSVWVGATITAFLFTIGKTALGFYFGNSQPGSPYGAAGSVILMLLWVSYSCLILFFGAVFTKVYAEQYGHHFQPSRSAVWERASEKVAKKVSRSKEK
jgi:membrane protein